jgi:cation:H+ antiporter
MIESLTIPVLLLIFVISAVAIWFAGIKLSKTADILAIHFGLGEALGGLILLAIVTNLPEIAITVSAAIQHNLDLAIGNILGGIAIQTVVLVFLDVFGLGKQDSLTYRAASLVLVLEGLIVIVVLTLVVVGNQLSPSIIYHGVSPIDLIIVLVWFASIYMIGKARTDLPWHKLGALPDSQKEKRGHSKQKNYDLAIKKGTSIQMVILLLLIDYVSCRSWIRSEWGCYCQTHWNDGRIIWRYFFSCSYSTS